MFTITRVLRASDDTVFVIIRILRYSEIPIFTIICVLRATEGPIFAITRKLQYFQCLGRGPCSRSYVICGTLKGDGSTGAAVWRRLTPSGVPGNIQGADDFFAERGEIP